MFTGIIENTGIIREITGKGTNKTFRVESPLTHELKVDQSLSHSGVCLTVEEIKDGMHRVTAIEETILKTNLGDWKNGTIVNLERCMQLNGRLDGHIVQGHVDCTGNCIAIVERDGSREYSFSFSGQYAKYIIEKGSITLNGISLTCFNVGRDNFCVAIIPYTYHHTNMHNILVNDKVNIEFDVIGKYIDRKLSLAK